MSLVASGIGEVTGGVLSTEPSECSVPSTFDKLRGVVPGDSDLPLLIVTPSTEETVEGGLCCFKNSTVSFDFARIATPRQLTPFVSVENTSQCFSLTRCLTISV